MSASFYSAAELANIAAAFWPEEHSFKANVRNLAKFAGFNNKECDRPLAAAIGAVEIKRAWEQVRHNPNRLAAARSVAAMRLNISEAIALFPTCKGEYSDFLAWLDEIERLALFLALQQCDALSALADGFKKSADNAWHTAEHKRASVDAARALSDRALEAAERKDEQISLIGRFLRENVPHFANAKKAERYLHSREVRAEMARENGDTDFFTRPGAIPPIQVVACAKACGYDLKMKSSGE